MNKQEYIKEIKHKEQEHKEWERLDKEHEESVKKMREESPEKWRAYEKGRKELLKEISELSHTSDNIGPCKERIKLRELLKTYADKFRR